MSVLPEVILHKAIVQGLRNIRKDTRILDALFRNLDQQHLQAMKKFITKESIHFTINYPRADALHLPTVALILKSENEANTFLGDIMGASPYYDMPDQELAIDTLGGHGASTSTTSGLPRKLLGPLRVHATTYDPERDLTVVTLDESHEDEFTAMVQDNPPSSELYTVGGVGSGQVGTILAFRSNALDIDGRFDPQLDSSSLVDIRLADSSHLPTGEPSRVYPTGATNLLRKGANFNVQYQLSIVAGHQDEVLYLYSILKALLFSQKTYMEGQGIIALQISGTDYAPRSEFLPIEAFQRVMTLQFTYPFSFLEEIDTYSEIQVNLTSDTSEMNVCSDLSFSVLIDDD